MHVFVQELICTQEYNSPCRIDKGVQAPRAAMVGDGESLRGCWGLNLGPLQEPQVFLTAEPSL